MNHQIHLLGPLAAGILLFCMPNAKATDRFFGDLEATSPNGRYRVEAKSPDNVDGPWKRPFQARFTYRLTDREEHREQWVRQQPMTGGDSFNIGEGPPTALFVNDRGWVVILTADVWQKPIELIALSSKGAETMRVDLLAAWFPDKNSERRYQYIGLSSAGRLWGSAFCHFYFAELNGAPHFCLRAWWGQRLLLDLAGGKLATVTAKEQSVLFSAERAFVLAALTGAQGWQWHEAKQGEAELVGDKPTPSLREGFRAAHMAGTLKIREAVPLLQTLENCPYVGTTVGTRGPYEAPDGRINPYAWQNLTARQLAQLSLRRLGVQPSGHQTTRLHRAKDGYWQPQDPRPFRRELRAAEIRAGMTPDEVLDKMGAPDFLDNQCWEYDLDGDTPCTLLVAWGKEGVSKTQRIVPAKWADGENRDRQFTE
jgi:hypothetical protein